MVVRDRRRLANRKTREEVGLDYVMRKLELMSPFGKEALKNWKPFFPGEEDQLREHLNQVETLLKFIRRYPQLYDKILEIFMEVRDSTGTVRRASKDTLSVVEIHEIKSLLLQMRQLLTLTKEKKEGDYRGSGCISEIRDNLEKTQVNEDYGEEVSIPDTYILADTEKLLDVLDPRKDRINAFYIYDEFSETLAELRREKRTLEKGIRRSRRKERDALWKDEGIQLTPKFDIVVARSHPDVEKIKSCEKLEEVAQDYMSITFQLKSSDEVFLIMAEIEELNKSIEAEEEKIAQVLTKQIAKYSQEILDNCNKMGILEVDMAKAMMAHKRKMVKPEIVDAHILEFSEGRNLEVEEILTSKGKNYCPISIKLEDGVTCITGANMGGKTISLKLAGQMAILAQYGFFVPAKSAKVGISNYMQILIGDSQSVQRGLSSFGSEMEELKEILDKGQDRSLILIDEIASGTNPIEGLALTKSIIDYLIEKPYISLITTHFETVTEKQGVVNMQVVGLANADFTLLDREIRYANRKDRIDIISKYMDYRLYRVDTNGEIPKDALNIAKMLGIGSEIIDRAKKYIIEEKRDEKQIKS